MFRILSIVVLCAAGLYFAVQMYLYISDPLATSVVYPAGAENSVSVDGWVARDEETFHLGNGILVHNLRDGERVGAGQLVVTAYNSASAIDTFEELKEQKQILEQQEFALRTYLDPNAALKLDENINESILKLRGDVSEGNYTMASENMDQIKGNVLKRGHSYKTDAEIKKDIQSTKNKIKRLEDSLADATVIRAEKSGTYSSNHDGYEKILTPKMLENVTPSKLEKMRPKKKKADVGKLVYGNTWYYTAILDEKDAEDFIVGQEVTLRFAKGLELDVPARVERVSKAEKGHCAVVWAADQYMAQVTELRSIQAEVIHHSYEGLRIPAQALRVEDGQAGVYCLTGMKA